jgi:large subunit ribosomal protein L33
MAQFAIVQLKTRNAGAGGVGTLHLVVVSADEVIMARGNRIKVHLECTTCRSSELPGVSRYTTTKNKKTMPGRLELNKYCRFERKHTLHKETK